MPKKGQVSITISSEIYQIAEDDAKSEHRSIANYIKHLVLQEHELKKEFAKIRKEKKFGNH